MSQVKKELLRFLVAGVSAVGVDLVAYYLLQNFLSADISKGISFILGTIVAFLINKYWTFEQKEKSVSEIVKFIILYGCTFSVNVFVNKFVLESAEIKTLLGEVIEIKLVAFVIATGASTILNFIGQKWWVFKSNKEA